MVHGHTQTYGNNWKKPQRNRYIKSTRKLSSFFTVGALLLFIVHTQTHTHTYVRDPFELWTSIPLGDGQNMVAAKGQTILWWVSGLLRSSCGHRVRCCGSSGRLHTNWAAFIPPGGGSCSRSENNIFQFPFEFRMGVQNKPVDLYFLWNALMLPEFRVTIARCTDKRYKQKMKKRQAINVISTVFRNNNIST